MPRRTGRLRRFRMGNKNIPTLDGSARYYMTTDIVREDFDDDGLDDLDMSHQTWMNNDLIYSCDMRWYGLPVEMQNSIKESMDLHNIKDDEEIRTSNFREVLNYWARLAMAICHTNRCGHGFMDEAKKHMPNVVDTEAVIP